MDSLLSNAVQSIEIGVEDFRSSDQRRLVSAVRNVQAGMLLLCKEKLRRLSPPGTDEVLIKARIAPGLDSAGQLAFRGQGEKTVDEQQIVERFGQLGIQLDWSPLRKLTSHRNVLEHYRYLGSREELREVVAQSATMIRRLFDVLGLDPVDILDADCWEFLLENEAVFQEELARSRASIQMMRWRSPTMARAAITDLSCINCRSELLELENPDNVDQETARLKCRACGWTFSAKERIWPTLVQYFGQDLYEAATQGGLPPVFKCDVCREVAVVAQEGECACCGKSGYELRCEVCNAILTDEDREQGDSRCLQHVDSQYAFFSNDRTAVPD
ncbi:hypothetical protein [Phenylobacterium aquaticum]|uniref:hypothetical protein n=1 Tax=Phenylobacterium aquaticum TaxID=1763816 RepID=UPI001F5CEF0B|nr:hypothetical protein [Phenylobacterium aquaticum]MCI3133384.1 hypothetical protein [Phenylobacterium aquaticum]